MSSRIPLTLACWDYDRTEPLRDGTVRPDGIDLTYLSLPVEETFYRMLRYREFDAAEMSLSSYLLSTLTDSPFIAIPVFPSRMFRHNSVYLPAQSRVEQPADLVGGVVGVPEYEVTAAVWIRGIFAERHGLPVRGVRYRTGGIHQAGRVEKMPLRLPAGIQVDPIPTGRTLVDMMCSGELDALYTPRTPRAGAGNQHRIRPMFPQVRQVEEEYFRETGIFPIMHTVVLRRDVYEKHPWIAGSLYKAFHTAKNLVQQRLDELAALRYLLPWMYDDLARTRALMGDDYWSYGLAANETTLKTFLRYAHEQGLSQHRVQPAELFAPETLDSFKI
jgi:4,5-dihydroxyphthalate decarboxylase